MADLRVELLYTPSCPHHEQARTELRRILGEYAIETPIQLVLVERIEDAEFLAFAGSPTIRIDGVDLVPAEEDQPAGIGCRSFRRADGSASWVVPEEVVRAAIRERRRSRLDAFARDEASLHGEAGRQIERAPPEEPPGRSGQDERAG